MSENRLLEVKVRCMYRGCEYKKVNQGEGFDYSNSRINKMPENYSMISDGYALTEDLHKHMFLLGADEVLMKDIWDRITKPDLEGRGYVFK